MTIPPREYENMNFFLKQIANLTEILMGDFRCWDGFDGGVGILEAATFGSKSSKRGSATIQLLLALRFCSDALLISS